MTSIPEIAAPQQVRRDVDARPVPPSLLGAGVVVVVTVLLPLVFLLVEAADAGWSVLHPLIFRHLTLTLIWNTVRLALAVTAICAVVGVAVAWCVERTDVPWRRFWTIVLVLPLAVPDFVLAYSWVSLDPSIQGYWGSVLVMSLGSYPLVYLPVAAALRTADPSLEDVARGLGLGRVRTFFGVTMHQIRPALLGGSLLVALILLAEFGTFEILRFQTFTTQIYTEFQRGYSTTVGCGLSLVLVLLGLLVLIGEAAGRGRAGAAQRGQIARPAVRVRLGRWKLPVVLGLAALLVAAIGLPIYALGYWFVQGTSSTLPPVSILHAALNTALYSGLAGALAVVAALPIALLVERHRSRTTIAMERSTYIVQALPGIVVALSLVYFTVTYVPNLYQSSFELVCCLRDHVLPARARLGAKRGGPGAAGARGGRQIARPRPAVRPGAHHAPRPCAGPRGGVLARLHQRLHRAHGDADPAPDGREHARDRLLGLHDRFLLRRRCAVRVRAAPGRAASRPAARPLVRADRRGGAA